MALKGMERQAASSRRLIQLERQLQHGQHACSPAAADHSQELVEYLVEELEQTNMFQLDEMAALTPPQVQHFMTEGYVLLPAIVKAAHVDALCSDVNRCVSEPSVSSNDWLPDVHKHVVQYEELGKLCSHPPVLEKVKQLMSCYGNRRTEVAMHHIHVAKMHEGEPGVGWHQVRVRWPCLHASRLCSQ